MQTKTQKFTIKLKNTTSNVWIISSYQHLGIFIIANINIFSLLIELISIKCKWFILHYSLLCPLALSLAVAFRMFVDRITQPTHAMNILPTFLLLLKYFHVNQIFTMSLKVERLKQNETKWNELKWMRMEHSEWAQFIANNDDGSLFFREQTIILRKCWGKITSTHIFIQVPLKRLGEKIVIVWPQKTRTNHSNTQIYI